MTKLRSRAKGRNDNTARTHPPPAPRHNRVIVQAAVHYRDFLAFLRQLPRRQTTLLVAVDGCGGTGKSTFARMLARHGSNVSIVEVDDFYLPTTSRPASPGTTKTIAADLDWSRLAEQVLEPLQANEDGCYQRYDWVRDALAEFHTAPIGGTVIVEGVYSLLPELTNYYDFRVWLDTPYEIRLKRGLQRVGEEARERWVHDWMPAEQYYIETYHPHEQADIESTAPAPPPHDPTEEFIRTG